MAFTTDAAKALQELNLDLIPPGETVRAAIRAMPQGELARRSAQVNLRVGRPAPIPIAYEGSAAEWPNRFARNESVPDSWSDGTDWFFWLVITDKQLHVFEGRIGKGWSGNPTAGPEAAHYPLDLIAEITFQKGLISQLAVYFKDGSSVELEVGKQKIAPFLDSIAPFVRADSTRPQATVWAPRWWRWALGIALLVGGMAMAIGGAEDGAAILVIGIVALVLGIYVVLRAWRS